MRKRFTDLEKLLVYFLVRQYFILSQSDLVAELTFQEIQKITLYFIRILYPPTITEILQEILGSDKYFILYSKRSYNENQML